MTANRKRQYPIRNGLATIAAAAGLTAAAGPALAQNLLEEITVTAQRREQKLQEVPLAVTAYDDAQLERLQVTEALDTAQLVPNLIGHNNTGLGTANAYSLRGLNNTESIATFDPPVGSYVDDIYVARQNANNFTFFDVERVEVLRGPQGTLFGRNTTGGAVRVLLKKPAAEAGGYLEGGYGDYERFNGQGSIDVPLSETFLTKFSGYYINDEGYVDNVTTGDTLNYEDNYGLRAAFLWLLSDAVSWDLAFDYSDDQNANIVNSKQGGSRISRTGLSEDGGALRPFFTNEKRNYGLGNEVQSFNITSNLVFETGIGDLSFITGYRNLDQEFALDFFDGNAAGRAASGQAPPNYGGFTIANDGTNDQFTQEIRLVGQAGDWLDYVGGVYYFKENNTTDFGDLFDFDLSNVAPVPPGSFIPLVLADRVMENSTDAWAAYWQGDFHVTDKIIVTAGVRYTDENKDISYSDNQPCAIGPPGCGDANGDGIGDSDLESVNLTLNGIPLEQSESLWTPRAAVQYTFSDDANVYLSATRGFKSGGWNARGTSPDQLQPFDAEVVWSYEAGLRSDWFDDRLRLNLTYFFADVSDFQVPSAFNTATGIQFITRNFAGLENQGLELETIWNPIENLTLLAVVGIQDGEYVDIAPAIQQQQAACQAQLSTPDPDDDTSCDVGIVGADGGIADPTRIPDYTATVGANYVWEIGNGLRLIPSAYVYSVGEHTVFTSGGDRFTAEYTTYNASVELQNTEGNWSATLGCRNCNDRTMLVSALAGFLYYQEPMTWNLQIRKEFGSSIN